MTDAARPLPLYEQLAARLRAQIAAGDYPRGAAIPSEHELAAAFAVGRPTVRQATELLVNERLLERRRGSGTYVTEPPREVDLLSAAGTLASLTRSRLAIETRILSKARLGPLPRALREGAAFSGDRAYRLVRWSAADGTPVLLEEMYFDPQVFPNLEAHVLEGRSLSQLARDAYRLRAESAEQRFGVIALDATRARRLGLAVGAPILKVERTVGFRRAPGALFAELYCRTDRVRFTQRLSVHPDRTAAYAGTDTDTLTERREQE